MHKFALQAKVDQGMVLPHLDCSVQVSLTTGCGACILSCQEPALQSLGVSSHDLNVN